MNTISIVRTILEVMAVLATALLFCYQQAVPVNLSDPCEIRDFQLTGTTLFITKTRPVFQNFWNSEHALTCLDDAVEEEEVVDEAPTDAFDSVLAWTENFGAFANTMVEDALLPKLPDFLSTKVRSVATAIADSWEPSVIKNRTIDIWTTTIKPHIPDSVVVAWEDAFAPDDQVNTAQTSANTTAADAASTPMHDDMNAEDLDGSVEVGFVRAFFKFAFAAAQGKVANKASQLLSALQLLSGNVMDHCQAAISRAWQQVINYLQQDFLKEFLKELLFCVTFIIIFGAIMGVIWMGLRWNRRRKQASKLTFTFQCLRRSVDSPGSLSFDMLMQVIVFGLPQEEEHFNSFRTCCNRKNPQSKRVTSYMLLASLNPDLLPAHYTKQQKEECKRLRKVVKDAAKADGLNAPPTWEDFKALRKDAEEEPLPFDDLVELVDECFPDDVEHFNKHFREYYRNGEAKKTQALNKKKLMLGLHPDKLQTRLKDKENLNECCEMFKLINNAADLANVP